MSTPGLAASTDAAALCASGALSELPVPCSRGARGRACLGGRRVAEETVAVDMVVGGGVRGSG
jgi:hypothetical protein